MTAIRLWSLLRPVHKTQFMERKLLGAEVAALSEMDRTTFVISLVSVIWSTVGLFSKTYLDLMLAASALRDPEFRRPLPTDDASTPSAVTAGQLIARISDLDLANAAQTLKEGLIAEQP